MKQITRIADRIWASKWKYWLLPLSFLFNSLLNFAFYYVGLAYEDNPVREYGFIIGQLAFAIICGVFFLVAISRNELSKTTVICLLITIFFFAGSFLAGLINFEMTSAWKDYFVKFICFALPAGLAGICAALSRAEQRFLQVMEKLSFFAFPGGIVYFFGVLVNCNPFGYGRSLGIVDYMGFAYTIMPFLLVHIICMVDKEELVLPFLNRTAAHPQIIRGIMISVYWIAIIGSGTRGTYVCVVGFCVLLVLFKLFYREIVGRAIGLFIALFSVLLFTMFVYAPPGMHAVSRMNMFLEGIVQGEIVTSQSGSDVSDDTLKELANMSGEQQIINLPTEPEGPTDSDILQENIIIDDRGTMYKLSFMEFLKSPINGMGGVGGWPVKYGGNPHNVILEAMCETGLLGTIPFMLMVVLAIWNMLKAGKENRNVRYLMLIFLTYAIRANISGHLWICDYLLCALGYGLTLPSVPYQKRKTVVLDEK